MAKPVPVAKPVSPTGKSATEPVPAAKPVSGTDEVPLSKAITLPEGANDPASPSATGDASSPPGKPTVVDPVEADRNKDGELSGRELALQDHREQLEIFDLNGDKKISPDEWKAANKEDRTRDKKFFLVDKDEDGNIDEDEAVRFVMERLSLSSTYVDTTGDEKTGATDNDHKENAPSEVRLTLFSIPLGD